MQFREPVPYRAPNRLIVSPNPRLLVITRDKTFEKIPHGRIRPRKIDMAAPDPWSCFLVVLDERERVRIMHDDEIVL